jgi:hypothetical protein
MKRPEEAAKWKAKAVNLWDRIIELTPKAEQPALRASRANSLVEAGMLAQAVADVAELTMVPDWSACQWYDFACIYALVSTKMPDKKQEYADRAMELLTKAVKNGYTDAAHISKDPDLDSLRERDDFKGLLEELRKISPPMK